MFASFSRIAQPGLGITLAALAHLGAWGGEAAPPMPLEGEYQVILGGSNWARGTFSVRFVQGRLEWGTACNQEETSLLALNPARVDGFDGYSTVPSQESDQIASEYQLYAIGDVLCGHYNWTSPSEGKDSGTVPFHGWRAGGSTPAKRLEEARQLVELRKPLEAVKSGPKPGHAAEKIQASVDPE